MARKQFKLPDLGEGLTEGEILQWLVKPGETIRLNQPIVEVETAKAAVEVPSPYAGVVAELLYEAGTTVDVGTPIITVETEPGATGGAPTDAGAADLQAQGAAANPAESATAANLAAGGAGAGRAAGVADTVPAGVATLVEQSVGRPGEDEAVEPGLIGGPAPGGRTSVLVGYGPRSVAARRRPRVPAAAEAPAPPRPPARVSAAAVGAAAQRLAAGGSVLAKPPVRRLARDLGVNLATVRGSGSGGVISRADVEAAARPARGPAPADLAPGPDPVGETEATRQAAALPAAADQRIPVRGVRKATAAAMVASAFTAPHVTEFLAVDVTRMMRTVRRLRGQPGFEQVRVSPLLLVAKALLIAVRRHPMVNSSWDEAAQEIVVRGTVNLGIAAATPRGLIVPNVKGADRLALPDLARALSDLVGTARDGRTTPADLRGGTITITNVGVFGVDTGTPILNPGESAILAFGAVREAPWVHKGRVKPRAVTQLALSFDHRVVDGELGSLFLADVGRLLGDPLTMLAWG